MQERSRTRAGRDLNLLAKSIVAQATGEGRPMEKSLLVKAMREGKNPAAVALGRLGGLVGGKARAEKLSAQKRREIARKAAQSRWAEMAKNRSR